MLSKFLFSPLLLALTTPAVHMQPEAVANLLVSTETEWLTASKKNMLASCSEISSALIDGSDGEKDRLKAYFGEVCQSGGNGCGEFADSLLAFLSENAELNRDTAEVGKFCEAYYAEGVGRLRELESEKKKDLTISKEKTVSSSSSGKKIKKFLNKEQVVMAGGSQKSQTVTSLTTEVKDYLKNKFVAGLKLVKGSSEQSGEVKSLANAMLKNNHMNGAMSINSLERAERAERASKDVAKHRVKENTHERKVTYNLLKNSVSFFFRSLWEKSQQLQTPLLQSTMQKVEQFKNRIESKFEK